MPEVETIRYTLAPKIVHKTIKTVDISLAKLVIPEPQKFRAQIQGRKILRLWRRGKYLLLDLSGQLTLMIHFRMTGQLVYFPPSAPHPPYTHIVFTLNQGVLVYADLRQFGRLELLPSNKIEKHPILSKLGPEPLGIKREEFEALLKAKRVLKALLLDQNVIAGLGNIYVDEILFCAAIAPHRKACSLSRAEISRLFCCLQRILKEAILLGGSSVRNYVNGLGYKGKFQERHKVYHRRGQPCPRCGHAIVYTRLAGRGTYYCPQCQY